MLQLFGRIRTSLKINSILEKFQDLTISEAGQTVQLRFKGKLGGGEPGDGCIHGNGKHSGDKNSFNDSGLLVIAEHAVKGSQFSFLAGNGREHLGIPA